MPQNYTPEFKKEIVRLHGEEGRTYKSAAAEYGVSEAGVSKWCSQLREECQKSPEIKEEYDAMKEIFRLRKELEATKKEIDWRPIGFLTNIIQSLGSGGRLFCPIHIALLQSYRLFTSCRLDT